VYILIDGLVRSLLHENVGALLLTAAAASLIPIRSRRRRRHFFHYSPSIHPSNVLVPMSCLFHAHKHTHTELPSHLYSSYSVNQQRVEFSLIAAAAAALNNRGGRASERNEREEGERVGIGRGRRKNNNTAAAAAASDVYSRFSKNPNSHSRSLVKSLTLSRLTQPTPPEKCRNRPPHAQWWVFGFSENVCTARCVCT
jgi:hypothetical protein